MTKEVYLTTGKKVIAIDIQDSYNKLHNNVKDTSTDFKI
jgi:hypothetical protein